MQSMGLMMWWLTVVLVTIPLALWLLKRSGVIRSGSSHDGVAMLKTVGQTSVGPGQRVVTVEINAGGERTWLVLGVTPQQITPLHTMAPPAPDEVRTPTTSPLLPAQGASLFSAVMRRTNERFVVHSN
jgi:flagellar protein FliO/FliZ